MMILYEFYVKKVKQARPSKGDSIEQRPEEIDDRNTFGHWEMDCVVGTQTTPKDFWC